MADALTSAAGPLGRPPPLDALLDGYVFGRLNPYLHALVEAHLILSPANRVKVRTLEEAAGEELEAMEPAPIQRPARDHVLAAIYAGGWYGRPQPDVRYDPDPPAPDVHAPDLPGPDLPEPVARLVNAPLESIRWRFAAPGVREHKIFERDGLSASLLRAKPSRRMPRHTHSGQEATLVLKGGFSDHLGHYRRGDVALVDRSIDHRPVADPGEPCLCFVVTEGELKLTGPIGRLLQRAFGG